ncbi:MAG: hypothetical protein OIF32_02130 [Campylobacterales bacterium]|nr:hypothetical protein [Campylobacterales bacterium]
MIVSDSTTLIILSDLKRLDLLENLFDKILIPSSVYKEVNVYGTFQLNDFIEIVDVKESELLESLKRLLDLGESEAIALAKERNLPLIIDEKKGRKIALNLDLKILGLLGIIYLNIKREFLTKQEAKEFLQQAVKNGYRISKKLIEEMFKSL